MISVLFEDIYWQQYNRWGLMNRLYFLSGPLSVSEKARECTHSAFCQVLNMEVDLSWYEQPSRRSHLDQSILCRLFKTGNKLQDQWLDILHLLEWFIVVDPPNHHLHTHTPCCISNIGGGFFTVRTYCIKAK